MNIAEANAVSALLRWITRAPGVAGNPLMEEQVRADGEYLAGRVNLALKAGITPAEVRDRWPSHPAAAARDGLTEGEQRQLRRIARIRCANEGTCDCPELRRGIADLLRAEHPELSDVALARIVLEAGGLLIHYAQTYHLSGTGAAAVIAGAALELASLEIGEPHP